MYYKIEYWYELPDTGGWCSLGAQAFMSLEGARDFIRAHMKLPGRYQKYRIIECQIVDEIS